MILWAGGSHGRHMARPNPRLQRTPWRSPLSRQPLGAMKYSAAVAALLALLAGGPATAGENQCHGKLRLTFSLLAKEAAFHSSLEGDLELYAVRDGSGWEIQVFNSSDHRRRDNLLYPEHWHGAFPCQLQPAVHSDVFPDERVIQVRSTSLSICVKLIGLKTTGESSERRYGGGTVEIRANGA